MPYKKAIEDTLADRVSYAQFIKVYRAPKDVEKRYSPAEVSSGGGYVFQGDGGKPLCQTRLNQQHRAMREELKAVKGIRPTLAAPHFRHKVG